MRVNRRVLEALSPGDRVEAEAAIARLRLAREENPLQFFEPHSDAQREFFLASTPVVAAFAGNRFGKTTSLVVRTLMEVCDRGVLPEFLRGCKRFDPPVDVWIVCPTNDKLYDSLLPTFQRWCPAAQYRGGVFSGKGGGAWSKERRQLVFENGSTVSFKTYEQDASTLGGAALHVVGYDEPPPRKHREECMTRLLDHGGYELFAMTPLQTNTGWIRRDIFRQRESPDITVVRGSMHDNPTLDKETVARNLEAYASDLWRRAREFGDFVDVGGQIYPDFERAVHKPWAGDVVRSWDVVVGIDPGIKNAAFIWVGFDRDNTAHVFDELLLQDRTPADYVRGIREVNEKWGLGRPLYVIDPNAATRAAANAERVDAELLRRGIAVNGANNQVDAGIQQARVRMQHKRLWVSEACRGLRDEADEYAAEDREDGEFKVIKQNDHRLDAMRYALMARTWDPVMELAKPKQRLGWEPDTAPALVDWGQPAVAVGPMGSMS